MLLIPYKNEAFLSMTGIVDGLSGLADATGVFYSFLGAEDKALEVLLFTGFVAYTLGI